MATESKSYKPTQAQMDAAVSWFDQCQRYFGTRRVLRHAARLQAILLSEDGADLLMKRYPLRATFHRGELAERRAA